MEKNEEVRENKNYNMLPKYIGSDIPNCDYTHGQIQPMPGVKSIQIVRANRKFSETTDGTTTTYKHAPDIATANGTYYVAYLVNNIDEHEPGGFSILAMSRDLFGKWNFIISFPEYRIPKCVIKDYKGITHEFDGNTYGFMHQRMSFYKSKNNKLLLLGFYGWSPEKWMTNWDNYGIGRVVREIYEDGTMSDIYFIYPNYQAGWSDELLNYPLYTKSSDNEFVEACKELLDNRLYTQQWAEENGDASDIITIKHPQNGTNQAFCWYHIDEEEVIGLWKHSKVARSHDNGKTWSDIKVEHSLIMSGQKIWGQKCGNNGYVLIYDPTLESTHRYPMCIVTSKDGINFDNMKLIHGEVPMKRYAGFWKDYGPQYMRGLTEELRDETLISDKEVLLTYSVNKEDIWVSRIPVKLDKMHDLTDYKSWNIYKPLFSNYDISEESNKLTIKASDFDPVDHFCALHVLEKSNKVSLNFEISVVSVCDKPVYVELLDDKNIEAVRIIFKENGMVYVRTVDDIGVCEYEKGRKYHISIEADCRNYEFSIKLQGKKYKYRFYRATNNISAIKISTGKLFGSPKLTDDPEKQKDLPKLTEERLKASSEFEVVF